MILLPPRSTRTDTLFPYTTRFRSTSQGARARMDILVSTDWLEGELGKPDLRIVDASLFLPGVPRDPRAEFEAAHIPGAAFLDLPTLADPDDPRPGMLPTDDFMTERCRRLGIDADSRIVVYDNSPPHSAARGWWIDRKSTRLNSSH